MHSQFIQSILDEAEFIETSDEPYQVICVMTKLMSLKKDSEVKKIAESDEELGMIFRELTGYFGLSEITKKICEYQKREFTIEDAEDLDDLHLKFTHEYMLMHKPRRQKSARTLHVNG